MRLNVCMVSTKDLLDALTSEVFYLIYAFAAALITLSGIALSVLIGQMAAHCCHNCLADKVLGSDKLQMAALTCKLLLHVAAKLRIVCTNQIELNHKYLHRFYRNSISAL